MINVCMTENHAVEVRRREWERRSISDVPFSTALNHPAVEQNALAPGTEEVTGARNLAGRPMKRESHEAVINA